MDSKRKDGDTDLPSSQFFNPVTYAWPEQLTLAVHNSDWTSWKLEGLEKSRGNHGVADECTAEIANVSLRTWCDYIIGRDTTNT